MLSQISISEENQKLLDVPRGVTEQVLESARLELAHDECDGESQSPTRFHSGTGDPSFEDAVLPDYEYAEICDLTFGCPDIYKANMEAKLEAVRFQELPALRKFGKIKRWQRGIMVGSGSYGKVFLGLNKDTAELFVVKQVTLIGEEECEGVAQLEQEIALLGQLEHENIVKYLGTEVNTITNELSIFLEYMPGGSVADLVGKFGALDEAVIRCYTRNVLKGLAFLHSKGIIHRDIKGQNLLVDSNGICKLADFGASRFIQSTDSVCKMSFKGTPVFMPPEVIAHQFYSPKSDVWSYGCTLLQMATGNPPFSDLSNPIAVLLHITLSAEPPPLPGGLSVAFRNFILRCLQREITCRASVEDLLQHEFLRFAFPSEGGCETSEPASPISKTKGENGPGQCISSFDAALSTRKLADASNDCPTSGTKDSDDLEVSIAAVSDCSHTTIRSTVETPGDHSPAWRRRNPARNSSPRPSSPSPPSTDEANAADGAPRRMLRSAARLKALVADKETDQDTEAVARQRRVESRRQASLAGRLLAQRRRQAAESGRTADKVVSEGSDVQLSRATNSADTEALCPKTPHEWDKDLEPPTLIADITASATNPKPAEQSLQGSVDAQPGGLSKLPCSGTKRRWLANWLVAVAGLAFFLWCLALLPAGRGGVWHSAW